MHSNSLYINEFHFRILLGVAILQTLSIGTLVNWQTGDLRVPNMNTLTHSNLSRVGELLCLSAA